MTASAQSITVRDRHILWDIYEEHLEEAVFLWSQWERALSAANYTIAEVASGPEERLLAHLDGLVLGGDVVAERLIMPALVEDEPLRVTVAAWVLLASEGADYLQRIWQEVLAAADPTRRLALRRALELSQRGDLVPWLLPRIHRHDPGVDATIIDVIAAHAPAELNRLPLRQIGLSASAELLGAVLRALRRAPIPLCEGVIERGLSSESQQTVAAALDVGALLHPASTRAACRRFVAERSPSSRLAMATLAVLGDNTDHQRLLNWSSSPDLTSDALWALGLAGSVAAAEHLLGFLEHAELGALAADSFGCITGLVIEGPFAQAGDSEGLDEMLDADGPIPEVKPEDDLAMPHPAAVRAWWRENQSRFEQGARYVYGRPWGEEGLAEVLASTPTWRRPVLWLGLGSAGGALATLTGWARFQATPGEAHQSHDGPSGPNAGTDVQREPGTDPTYQRASVRP